MMMLIQFHHRLQSQAFRPPIEIIKDHSHKRKQFVPSAASYGVGSYTSFPVEVFVGGATIFVTNIERFEKV